MQNAERIRIGQALNASSRVDESIRFQMIHKNLSILSDRFLGSRQQQLDAIVRLGKTSYKILTMDLENFRTYSRIQPVNLTFDHNSGNEPRYSIKIYGVLDSKVEIVAGWPIFTVNNGGKILTNVGQDKHFVMVLILGFIERFYQTNENFLKRVQ